MIRVGSLAEYRREIVEGREAEYEEARDIVKRIVRDVRDRGLEALREWSLKLDKMEPKVYRASDFEAAWSRLSRDVRESILALKDSVERFHRAQLPREVSAENDGLSLRLAWKPLDSVGVYVPGGRHPYFSTLVMGVVPAKVAGVRRVVVASPLREDTRDVILGAAFAAGVDELLSCGGAQAIAALAYGVAVDPVDKVVGPGSLYVQLAKLEVADTVGFDMVAGPTELVVISDGSCDPLLLAHDMLAQAEHGPASLVLLLDTDEEHMLRTYEAYRSRYEEGFARTYFLKAESLEECVDLVNALAPEHLMLALEDHEAVEKLVRNVGAISILTPPAIMDYCAGSNHILPTGGWARHRGALTVYDFLKPVPIVSGLSKELFEKSGRIAELEGFKYHRLSLRLRLRTRPCEQDNRSP